ncbi:hypothetical protein GCM10027403_18050 [Arthrobacter tecti]
MVRYQKVLEDVEAALGDAYPDAAFEPAPNSFDGLTRQDDGTCTLAMPSTSVSAHLLVEENRERTLAAVTTVLENHEFAEPGDVEQDGPIMHIRSEDSHGAVFRLRADNESEVSLTVPVTSPDCSA